MTKLVFMQSHDFTYGSEAHRRVQKDDFYKELDTDSYRGNINTSIIKTKKGRTITLQHDVSRTLFQNIHAKWNIGCCAEMAVARTPQFKRT